MSHGRGGAGAFICVSSPLPFLYLSFLALSNLPISNFTLLHFYFTPLLLYFSFTLLFLHFANTDLHVGNIGTTPLDLDPTTTIDLETPTLKSAVYTTGRGGSGNMARNEDPEEARRAQDVVGYVKSLLIDVMC